MWIRMLPSIQCLRISIAESVFEQPAELGGDGYLNREILRCDEMGDQVPNFGLTFLCSPDSILEKAFDRAEHASVERGRCIAATRPQLLWWPSTGRLGAIRSVA
jgi:hypothetical protein